MVNDAFSSVYEEKFTVKLDGQTQGRFVIKFDEHCQWISGSTDQRTDKPSYTDGRAHQNKAVVAQKAKEKLSANR